MSRWSRSARGEATEAGERVLLQDVKGRRYLITLEQGATFHTCRGRLAHDELIGSAEGVVAAPTWARSCWCCGPPWPTGWSRPRGAQVIYPRMLALMVMAADVQPGMTVVEAGTGSGRCRSPCSRPSPPAGGCTPSSAAPTSPTRPGATSNAGSASPRRLRAARRRRGRRDRRRRARGPRPARPAGAVAGRAGRGRGPAHPAGCWSASWPPCPRSCAWSRRVEPRDFGWWSRRPSSAPGTSTAWPSAPSTA